MSTTKTQGNESKGQTISRTYHGETYTGTYDEATGTVTVEGVGANMSPTAAASAIRAKWDVHSAVNGRAFWNLPATCSRGARTALGNLTKLDARIERAKERLTELQAQRPALVAAAEAEEKAAKEREEAEAKKAAEVVAERNAKKAEAAKAKAKTPAKKTASKKATKKAAAKKASK